LTDRCVFLIPPPSSVSSHAPLPAVRSVCLLCVCGVVRPLPSFRRLRWCTLRWARRGSGDSSCLCPSSWCPVASPKSPKAKHRQPHRRQRRRCRCRWRGRGRWRWRRPTRRQMQRRRRKRSTVIHPLTSHIILTHHMNSRADLPVGFGHRFGIRMDRRVGRRRG
jgi:hypothetical protein